MYCPLPSALTTVKSCPDPATRPSNCGTHWPNANTPFKMKATPTGCRACVSHQTTATRSSCPAAGTAPSRSGVWTIASWRSTTRDTTATWTRWPFHLMARSAPPVARTPRPSSGTWMTASTCTPWTTMKSSTHCASRQTVTGCALPMVHPSRSG